MIYLAEEIVESIKDDQQKLATKDDLKQVIELMNARFEAIEKSNAARFEALQKTMDERFAAVNVRFEAMDKRFESLEKRLGFIQWLIGSGVVMAIMGLFLVSLKLFFPHYFPH